MRSATLFQELTVAHEILSNPVDREICRARANHTERFEALDSKRKDLAENLVAREKAYKKARQEGTKEETREKTEVYRLQEEGKRLRQARRQKQDQRANEQEETRRAAYGNCKTAENELDTVDTTVRIKWRRKRHPNLELDKHAIYLCRIVRQQTVPAADDDAETTTATARECIYIHVIIMCLAWRVLYLSISPISSFSVLYLLPHQPLFTPQPLPLCPGLASIQSNPIGRGEG